MRKKICSKCKREVFLWRASPPLCKECSLVEFPNKINKVSKKRKKENQEYSILRKKFLGKNPTCQLKLQDCTYYSTDIHHKHSGKDRGKYLLDVSTWMGVCRSCHNKIHNVLTLKENLELKTKL